MIRRAIIVPLLLALALVLPARSALAIEIQQVTSPGGITAWLVEDHKNPIITVNLLFEVGQTSDPVGKEGRANLVSGLLDEGAGDLDSQAFQAALENNAMSLSFSARSHSFSGSLSTLTRNRDLALKLLRLSLTEPRFDAAPIARIKSQIAARIRRKRERPNTIASRTWWRVAFPDHPYGRSRDGTDETLAALSRDDLIDFTRLALTRDRLRIGVVGDINAAELAPLLDQVFGALPATSGFEPIPAVKPAADGALIVVERDVPQSVVVLGHAGLARDDPDWFAAALVMEVMAGGFGSRLTEEIREKRGLAYGVYAYQLPMRRSPLVMGGVSTQNARVAESIDLIRQLWAEMAETGPSAEELTDARTYMNGAFPLAFTDSKAIAGLLTTIQRYNLGADYLSKRAGYINSVTLEDARRVAKRLFRSEELSITVVGKPDGVTATRPAPSIE